MATAQGAPSLVTRKRATAGLQRRLQMVDRRSRPLLSGPNKESAKDADPACPSYRKGPPRCIFRQQQESVRTPVSRDHIRMPISFTPMSAPPFSSFSSVRNINGSYGLKSPLYDVNVCTSTPETYDAIHPSRLENAEPPSLISQEPSQGCFRLVGGKFNCFDIKAFPSSRRSLS